MRSLRRSGLYARGTVNGIACLWVIDTGAEVTVVRPGLLPDFPMTPSSSSLRTATGDTTSIVGRASVEVVVSGCLRTEHDVLIAGIEDDGILGMDFLSSHDCCIAVGEGSFRSGSKKISLQTDRDIEVVNPSASDSSLYVRGIDLVPSFLQDLSSRSSVQLDPHQLEPLRSLLAEFQDTFAKSSTVIGRCSVAQHRINVNEHPPIRQAARRLPLHGREEVAKLVEDMKTSDVIEFSSSPWASPIVLVNKKDGTKRFCIDYRRLNDVTKKDSYPLPRIEDMLDMVAGALWFSTIDLHSGYWQVAMAAEDKEKTAFVTGLGGLWQFKVMPFGLCNAPATFKRLMETVLEGLNGKICLVYIDDIIVYGKTFEEELSNLRQVFSRLARAGLKMSPKKCHLFQKEVKFLGHLVSSEGVRTDPEKIQTIRDWPQLANKSDVQSFVGLCTYYRKFVRGFATLAKPLHSLTGEKVVFE